MPGTTGATAATAVICQAPAADGSIDLQAVVANVGDSMALLCRRGKAIVLSTEHTVTSEADRLVRAPFVRCLPVLVTASPRLSTWPQYLVTKRLMQLIASTDE